jgi:hypothetical protein
VSETPKRDALGKFPVVEESERRDKSINARVTRQQYRAFELWAAKMGLKTADLSRKVLGPFLTPPP